VVLNLDADDALLAAGPHRDRPARSVRQRVGQQVPDHLVEPLRVGVDLQARLQSGHDALAARLGAERPDQRLQQLAQRDPAPPKLQPAVIEVGEVEDENAWALGGIAGHAGVFGTAPAGGAYAGLVLRTLTEETSLGEPWLLRRFLMPSRVPRSSRALGWDLMRPTSSCGHRLSASAFGHTGFTGVSLWIDPQKDVYVVLLTNRVHPTRPADPNDGLAKLRPLVHDAVMDALER